MTSPEPPATAPVTDAQLPPRRRSIGEWVVAVALLAIGILVVVDGLGQAASTSASGVGAGFVPTVVGAALIALSLLLMVQLARGRHGEPDEGEGDVDVRSTKWVPLAVCVAAVLIFIVAVEPVGYVIVSTVVFWLTAWAMGARAHWRSATIAVVLALVVYLSFTRLLSIDLPAGILEGVL